MSMAHVYVYIAYGNKKGSFILGYVFYHDERSRILVEHGLGTSSPSAEGTGNSDFPNNFDTENEKSWEFRRGKKTGSCWKLSFPRFYLKCFVVFVGVGVVC